MNGERQAHSGLLAHITRRDWRPFCERWKIHELALFGSVLRPDFRSDSDVDVLVEFEADAAWSLLDHIRLQRELQTLLQRKVDLITKRGLQYSQNWRFRAEVLRTARVVFRKGQEPVRE